MPAPYSIVALVGSLRKESFTLKIANALAKLAPASLKVDVTTLNGLSFFNQDLEANPPADWLALRDKLKASNGVLILTPEYNRSIPGVLKNAPLWPELVPGQAGRPDRKFAGPARWRRRGQASAEHHAGHRRSDHGPAGDLPQRRRRCLRRQG